MDVQNRLTALVARKKAGLLTIFLTAGYPEIESAVPVCEELERSGVDIIELGFPYSDSLVDGATIQMSNARALENGMTLERYFQMVAEIRAKLTIPLVFMGCLNPILQFGIDKFYSRCKQSGIDGLIVPDLPCAEYIALHQEAVEKNDLSVIFLVTARTSPERIREFDRLSNGFLYAVSSDATTGQVFEMDADKQGYFEKLRTLDLRNPVLVGFGIADACSFEAACQSSAGAIIGSAFIRALSEEGDPVRQSRAFVEGVTGIRPEDQV